MPNSAGYKSLLSKPLVCEYAKRSNAFRIRLSELQKIKQIEKDFLMDNNGSNAAIRGKVHFIGIGGCSMNGACTDSARARIRSSGVGQHNIALHKAA